MEKNYAREMCNACFQKDIGASLVKSCKNGQKIFTCSKCKEEFYQKNCTDDPFEKSRNKCCSKLFKFSILIAYNKKTTVEKNSMLIDKI
jgi:hypothetical protein